MADQSGDEKVVPLGVVLMTVGLIVVLTAVGIYFVLTRAAPQMVATLQPAILPSATPKQARGEDGVTLLPETPLEIAEDGITSSTEVGSEAFRGQPDRILIPGIDLDAPVSGIGLAQFENDGQTYFQWRVPSEFMAGWHNTSAPVGKLGNTVLNGHHNIFGEVFRDLDELSEGEAIIIESESKTYTYTISTIEILPEQGQPLSVRIENAQWIEPTDDERLTLVTCWPYEDNSHRLVVVAHPNKEATLSDIPSAAGEAVGESSH